MGDKENPFDSLLRESPQFAQLCQLIRSQPSLLAQAMDQTNRNNPELMQLIRDNQEAFIQILNKPAEGNAPSVQQTGPVGGVPAHQAGAMTIEVTATERDAIERIKSMGFPEQLVIEAYFACDKNEDLAVNYILSRMDE